METFGRSEILFVVTFTAVFTLVGAFIYKAWKGERPVPPPAPVATAARVDTAVPPAPSPQRGGFLTRDDCLRIQGNWVEAGSYCYVLRNWEHGIGAELVSEARKCREERRGFDILDKACFDLSLPAHNPCEKDRILDIGQKAGGGCAPLRTVECMARGGVWDSSVEPNFCREGDLAKYGQTPAFVQF